MSFQDDDGNPETVTSDATGAGGCRAERVRDRAADDQRDGAGRPGSERKRQRDQRRERPDESDLPLPVVACRDGGRGGGGHLRSEERDLHGGGGGPEQVPPSAGELPGRRRERSETATSDASGPVSAEANAPATGQPTISGTAQVGEDLSASVERDQRRERPDESDLRLPVVACRDGGRGGQRDIRSEERDLHSGGGGPEQIPPSAGELPGRRRERRDGDQRRHGAGVGGGERGGDRPADDQRDSPGRRESDRGRRAGSATRTA